MKTLKPFYYDKQSILILSSSIVKEVARYGGSVVDLVPPVVERALKEVSNPVKVNGVFLCCPKNNKMTYTYKQNNVNIGP